MKDRSHDQAMAELFGEDPAFAADYLTSVLQVGEQADVMIALRCGKWRLRLAEYRLLRKRRS